MKLNMLKMTIFAVKNPLIGSSFPNSQRTEYLRFEILKTRRNNKDTPSAKFEDLKYRESIEIFSI